MKNYEKPMIVNVGSAEGVYLASGAAGGDGECYTAWVTVDQWDTAEKRFHVYTKHTADHHSHGERIVITFPNTPVSCTFDETWKIGSHTLSGNTLTIVANRHATGNDDQTSYNFGIVFSDVPAGTKPGQPTAVCYDTAHHSTDGSECGQYW